MMFLSKNGISQSAKKFRKVDLDSWGQDALFFSQMFFDKKLMFLSKNCISQSAKQFCEMDLDSWDQDTTFFFQAFFDINLDVSKRHFA
jgi:hypothetical protein